MNRAEAKQTASALTRAIRALEGLEGPPLLFTQRGRLELEEQLVRIVKARPSVPYEEDTEALLAELAERGHERVYNTFEIADAVREHE